MDVVVGRASCFDDLELCNNLNAPIHIYAVECDIVVIGFILIQTDADKEDKVLGILKTMDEIDEAFFLFGEYDIIAKITARDFKEISNIVLKKIRSQDGVLETETLPGISF